MSQIYKTSTGGGGGGGTLSTLTPNSGGPVTSVANNTNVVGLAANPGGNAFPVFSYNGGAGQFNLESRTFLTPYVVDASATNGRKGTFTTVTAAIAQAVADGFQGTIFLRAGTYTENITLPAGINLSGFTSDALSSDVVLLGTVTMTAAGTSSITGIQLKPNGSNAVVVSGANAVNLNLYYCYLNFDTQTFISLNNTNATINVLYCYGDSTGLNATPFSKANGTMNILFCMFFNTGLSTTASTITVGNVVIRECIFHYSITTSGTGNLDARFCRFQTSQTDTTFLTHGGSVTGDVTQCIIGSGNGVAITVLAGCNQTLNSSVIQSKATGVITGAGTITYSLVSFIFKNLITTTTQVANQTSVGAYNVQTPAGNYTLTNSDDFVGVDTSAARTITMPSAPSTGKRWTIKDKTGTAAAFNITVSGGGHNIDGSASYTINTNFGSIDLIYNGTTFSVI